MAAFLPPGGLQEIVFSFDTTGSMSGCIANVKNRLQDMMQRLQADIPGIRIAVFAHGDYCDEDVYVTRYLDFTNNIGDLCQFVKDTKPTHGGDFEECYELVLRQVQIVLSWTPASQRSLVMIGDAIPHEETYPLNVQKIDWKKEVKAMKDLGVKIYSVQCDDDVNATSFFKHLAEQTNGVHLKLGQFSEIFDFLMAICYREQGEEFLQRYEKEVRARPKPISKGVHSMFGALRLGDSGKSSEEDAVESGYSSGSDEISAREGGRLKRPMKRTGSKLTPVVSRKPRKAKARLKVERCNREDVSQKKFRFKDLKWSPWTLAMVPKIPQGTRLWWVGRGDDKPGFKRDFLFGRDLSKPAVYELAVQSRLGRKRHVMYTKFVTGRKTAQSWESYLFKMRDIQAQIDNVLESRCAIYIRRAVCSSTSIRKTGHQLTRAYDYAWRRLHNVRNSHRDVRMDRKSISSSSF